MTQISHWAARVAAAIPAIEQRDPHRRGQAFADLFDLSCLIDIIDLDEQCGILRPDEFSPILVRQMIVAEVGYLGENASWPTIIFDALRTLDGGCKAEREFARNDDGRLRLRAIEILTKAAAIADADFAWPAEELARATYGA